MTYQEFVTEYAGRHNVSLVESRMHLDRVFDLITEHVVFGERLSVPRFGVFKRREYKSRTVQIGKKKVKTPKRWRVVFTAAKKLHGRVR